MRKTTALTSWRSPRISSIFSTFFEMVRRSSSAAAMKPPIGSRLYRYCAWLVFIVAIVTTRGLVINSAIAKQSATEIRAAWLPLGGHFSKEEIKGSTEVKACVNRLADAHFNTLFIWVTSEYAAALHNERYRSQEPLAKWDAVGVAIRAGAARGLQSHVWYSFTYYKSSQSPEFDPSEGGDPTWVSVAKEAPAAEARSADCCPMHPSARTWELNLIKQIIVRYPTLAGVHLEEPGYGYADRCICKACRDAFTRLHHAPLEKELDGQRAADLKCSAMAAFVSEVNQWRRQQGRSLLLSANGGADWRGERTLGRDWPNWAKLGWLDFYAAQVYTADSAEFSRQAATVIKDLAGSCPVVIGIGARWSGGENVTKSIVEQVELSRHAGAHGVAIYHGAVLSDECLTALKAGPFLEEAPLKARP